MRPLSGPEPICQHSTPFLQSGATLQLTNGKNRRANRWILCSARCGGILCSASCVGRVFLIALIGLVFVRWAERLARRTSTRLYRAHVANTATRISRHHLGQRLASTGRISSPPWERVKTIEQYYESKRPAHTSAPGVGWDGTWQSRKIGRAGAHLDI